MFFLGSLLDCNFCSMARMAEKNIKSICLISDGGRHLWPGVPKKHHSVPKELEEGIGIVMILDSQEHLRLMHTHTRRLVPGKNIKKGLH